MTVTADLDGAVTVVALHGPWGPRLGRDTYLALHKALAEHPAAIVLDLDALSDRRGSSASTWLNVRRVAAAMEPPVRAMVCLPGSAVLADRLARLGAASFLPVFPTVAAARAAVTAGHTLPDRLRLALPPHPDTPALARNLVTDACAAWDLTEVVHPGRLVMSELATNAVQHARTPLEVMVVRRSGALHLIVNDRDARMPHIVDRPQELPAGLWDLRGQGLRTVRAASAAWGALPTVEGKMVWATIRPRS